MKSIPVIWCLAAFLTFLSGSQACAQKKEVPKPAVRDAVNVYKSVQEWLLIFSDGSGTVGYGAGGSYQGHFKAGTFDLEQVTKQLKELPLDEKGKHDTHYFFTFESERLSPEKSGPLYFTQDKKVISSLFDKATEASGLTKNYFPQKFPNLEKLLPDKKK